MLQNNHWYDIYYFVSWTRGGRVYPNIDCWGLVCDAFKRRRNITLDAYTQFSESSMTNGMSDAINQFIKIDENDNFQELDIVCWIVGKQLRHVGIMINGSEYMHCDRIRGTCIGNIKDIIDDVNVYRYKGLIC